MADWTRTSFIGIGEMSRQTGVGIETIRYFEKIAMMPAPGRSEGGNRQYTKNHLQRLFFISRCRQLGFSQSEIKALLLMVDAKIITCSEVHDITVEHIRDIRMKIRDLRKLEKDSKTDWRAVDLDELRAHLLDMNHLILNTEASKSIIGDTQIQFDVRGTTLSVPSIHRMVLAHARFIEQSRGWTIEPKLNYDGAKLTITVEDHSTLKRVNALGFYGFMSLDSHHPAHHYQMAIGKSH